MDNKRSSIVRSTINRRKHKTLAAVGALVFLMAAIGLITVALSSVKMTTNLMDKTKDKQKLEHFILPVIMFDPTTFESPQTADPQMILRSSLWSALLSKGRDELATDDYGSVVLPASDIDVQAAKLYGPEVKVQHQTIQEDFTTVYIYDEEQKVYNVPVATQMAVYTPKILEITNKGPVYTLLVGYIPPGNLWQTDSEGNTYEPEPDKVMLMELNKVKDGYNIVALRDGPATTNNSQTQPMVPTTPVAPDDGTPEDETSSSEGETPSGAQGSSSDAEAAAAVKFDTISASSVLTPGRVYSYDAKFAADADFTTAWIEGVKGNGVDEWLLFEAGTPQTVSGLSISNGLTQTAEYYDQNNRVKKVKIEFSDGTSIEKELKDGYEDEKLEEITFDEPVTTSSIKLTILEVYDGTKYDDACISEVTFF